jgi:hypothetical protein
MKSIKKKGMRVAGIGVPAIQGGGNEFPERQSSD